METGARQRHGCCQEGHRTWNGEGSGGEGRDEVMADSGDRPGADAAAGERELIARLTRRRVASGLSQAHVARLMQTSQPAVARLESGRHDVALSTLTRYAGALGLTLDVLEDTAGQAGSSTAASVAAGTGRAGQVPAGQPPGAVSPGAAGGPTGRPGHGSVSVTQTPGQPDRDHVLTWRQRKVLQVIMDFAEERGYPPSMREIGDAAGLASTSSVAFQLATLQRKGYLHRRPQAVEVRLPGDPARPEPGREQDETAETPGVPVISLPPGRIGEGPLFTFRVLGDSMSGAGIIDGDLAVAWERPSAEGDGLRDGDLVAVDIDGEPRVRTYEDSDGQVILSPRNPAFMPAIADEKDPVRGRVIAILRGARPAA
jgi:repressor LexA